MSSNIGLIIWGCKGGHKVFCSNGIIDYKQEAFANTIKDIRSFVRFNLTKLTTYAIEFTDKYKVFTIYRSCNDSGTGGYVAITVYIPHELRVNGLRTSLDLMMDNYFKEFVHPTLGTYYDGKYDDIELFTHYIEDFSVSEDKPFKYSPSIQDDKPHLRLYERISEVDGFFESPYRKEFFKCQEVMFMSKELYDKRPETLRFNFEENIIDSVTDPEKLPQLYIGDSTAVGELTINGKNVDVSNRYTINASTTTVNITLRFKYCLDCYIKGNVATLVEEGKLQEKDGVIMLGSKLPMREYKNYTLEFTVNGKQVPEQLLYIKEANTDNSYAPIKGSKYIINGEKLQKDYLVSLKPYPDKSSNKIFRVHTFKPYKNVDEHSNVNIEIKSFVFTISYNTKISEDFIYVYLPKVDSVKIAVPKKTGEKICIFLPPDVNTSFPKFDTQDGETDCKWEGESNVLYLSPKVSEYELQIPELIKPMIKSWDFVISGKSKKKGQVLFSSGSTFKIKLEAYDKLNEGTLLINGECYYFVAEDNLRSITPLLMYVKLQKGNSDDIYRYAPYVTNETIVTAEDRIFPYKDDSEADIVINPNEYEKSVAKGKKPVVIISLGKKLNSSYYKKEEQKTKITEDDGAKEDTIKFKLTFVNCVDFHLTIGEQTQKLLNGYSPTFSSSHVIIYDRHERKMCTIYRDESLYTNNLRKQDEEKGFFISYGENGCQVEYKKKRHPFNKYLSLKWILPVLLVLLLGLSAKPLWNIIIAPSLPIVMNIQVTISDKPEFFGETIDGIKGLDDTSLINVDKANGVYFLQILWDKDSAANNEYVSLFTRTIFAKVGNHDVPFNLNEIDPHILSKLPKANDRINEDYRPILEKINIPSPLMTLINNVPSDSSTVYIFKEYYKILNSTTNENAVQFILNDAQKKLKRDTIDYNTFLEIFKKYENNDIYKIVLHTNEEMKSKLFDMEQKLKEEQTLLADAANKKQSLLSDNCTKSTLDKVEKWWSEQSQEQKKTIRKQFGWHFDNALPAYKTFFTTNRKEDMDGLYSQKKTLFSPKQRIIIQKYVQSTNSFTRMRTEFQGNKFKEPIENGYAD